MHKKTAEALAVLKTWIETKKFGSSRVLPSERQLCSQLSVGRGALRAITAQLVSEKYLTAVAGRGMLISYPKVKRGSSLKILVVMPASDRMYTREFVEILRGMVTEADTLAADLVISFDFYGITAAEAGEKFEKRTCDGVIFAEEIPSPVLAALEQLNLPFIAANYEEEGAPPFVRPDYRSIGRLAAGCLIEKGHRELGFIGADHLLYNDMRAGMEEMLAEHALPVFPELALQFPSRVREEEIISKISGLLKKRSGKQTAFFCGRDRWAKYLFETCRAAGLRIPEDISVIGYDNISWSGAEKAGLTTIEQPAFETGALALRTLVQAIDSGKKQVSSAVLPGKLIERASVNSCPVSR
ncbi:MAG: substrate-binding domain-containing protein [Lentisphaeria bacterium]|nr:substrate-binding domain-containing protein [Lentisphaeria bacterium]